MPGTHAVKTEKDLDNLVKRLFLLKCPKVACAIHFVSIVCCCGLICCFAVVGYGPSLLQVLLFFVVSTLCARSIAVAQQAFIFLVVLVWFHSETLAASQHPVQVMEFFCGTGAVGRSCRFAHISTAMLDIDMGKKMKTKRNPFDLTLPCGFAFPGS